MKEDKPLIEYLRKLPFEVKILIIILIAVLSLWVSIWIFEWLDFSHKIYHHI